MGAGNSACSSRWARCHEHMVARGSRVKNVATAYHRQPCNAIGSATLRGLVHEFTFTWVAENVQLAEERVSRREAEHIRDEEREEMMESAGVDIIINKPLPDFTDLKTIIDNVIDKRQHAETGNSSS